MTDLVVAQYAMLVLRRARLSTEDAAAHVIEDLLGKLSAGVFDPGLVAERANARAAVTALSRRFKARQKVSPELWNHTLFTVEHWLRLATPAT
jgi:hypothetical protein